MAGFSEVLGLENETLSSRLKFLSNRANWHRNRSDQGKPIGSNNFSSHLACSATLFRDCGALALLQGKIERARKEFLEAGMLRLKMGFYDGFYLMRLGEPGSQDGRVSYPEDRMDWLEQSLFGKDDDVRSRSTRAANSSPRQLISILQADIQQYFPHISDLARQKLKLYAAYPVGVTQTSVEQFCALLDELRQGEFDAGRTILLGMSIRRQELITTAQRDGYHWRLARRPADLIDMDLLSVGLTALEHDEELFERVRKVAVEFGDTVCVPFDAARSLRGAPPRPTPFTFVHR